MDTEMVLAEDDLQHIPYFLQKICIYNNYIFIDKNTSYELIITKQNNSGSVSGGPCLYELKSKDILGVCDLSKTILNINEEIKYSQIEFDVYFTYENVDSDDFNLDEHKIIYYLLKIKNNLVIMKKETIGITVHQQFKDVEKWVIDDCTNSGKTTLTLIRINKSKEIVKFDCADSSINNNLTSSSSSSNKQRTETRKTIEDRIQNAKSELLALKFDVQKYFTILSDQLRFGPLDIRGPVEEKLILTKYGDIWIKRCNDMIVIGIPILNCSFKRQHLIRNIRLSLVCDKLQTFEYNYQLYKFSKYNQNKQCNNIDKDFQLADFNNDWTTGNPSENILFAEASAVLIGTVKLNEINFIDNTEYELNCFIFYDIHCERNDNSTSTSSSQMTDNNNANEKMRTTTLQNYAGSIHLTTKILYDDKFSITFNRENLYKDLLAVTATSFKISIDIMFETINEDFYDFIIKQLKFTKINVRNTEETVDDPENAMEVDLDGCTMNTNNIECDTKYTIFYQKNDSCYWNGLIIRSYKIDNLTYKLQMYNKCSIKLLNFLQTLTNELPPETRIIRSNEFRLDNNDDDNVVSKTNDKNDGNNDNIRNDNANNDNVIEKQNYDLISKQLIELRSVLFEELNYYKKLDLLLNNSESMAKLNENPDSIIELKNEQFLKELKTDVYFQKFNNLLYCPNEKE